MVKRIQILIPIVILVVLLTGCRVVFYDESLDSQPTISKKSVEVTLEGSVHIENARLVIRGQTNLPKGTIILIGLRSFPENIKNTEILEGKGQISKDFTREYTAEIDEAGEFTKVIDKERDDQQFQLEVWFRPNLQDETVQDRYGKNGEFIDKGDGLIKYDVEGESLTGFVKYAPIISEYGGSWSLAPSISQSRPMR
ncbi:hypothetical protein [Bacillus sp. P14.5]|uniref:hypothetical protein n=1 Tax=Bacillus sp. P14.5 TaxID=1983400 RepID=UPI000DE986CB|nr:hypothetical protein [Bacillus sp. P14.5]